MLEKITIGIIFLISFVMVTTLIAFMNLKYTNIFEFDFSAVKKSQGVITKTQIEKIYFSLQKRIERETLDSLYAEGLDSVSAFENINKIASLKDSVKTLQIFISQLESRNNSLEVEKAANAEKNKSKTDYLSWTKKTASLYESMEADKAAKIILNYSDNIARDILYKMKKNKAAEILAELNPEVATRITRVE